MAAHAACSPSSASMWLVCPASVTMTKDMTRPSSKYAREGTAAHKVAEMILDGDIFLPDKIRVEGEEFIISGGMCRALNSYIDHVQKLQAQFSAQVIIERRVVVPGTSGKVWGTIDCGAIAPRGGLHVVDLKYGKGHLVEPDAPQLKLYGLGLANVFSINLESRSKVTLTVCQPRIGTGVPRSFTTTLYELNNWNKTVVRPAIDRIVKGDTTEHVGPHCRWCVRQTECEAFANRHQEKAASVFDDLELP